MQLPGWGVALSLCGEDDPAGLDQRDIISQVSLGRRDLPLARILSLLLTLLRGRSEDLDLPLWACSDASA